MIETKNGWPIWCHPTTYEQLRDECINESPSDIYGSEFLTDPQLPEGEYFCYPRHYSEFEDDTIDILTRRHVRQLVDDLAYEIEDVGVDGRKTIYPYFKVEKREFRFDIDSLSSVEHITEMSALIEKYLPQDHPPVHPEQVEWENTSDDLEVKVKNGQWIWIEKPDNLYGEIPISVTGARRDLETRQVYTNFLVDEILSLDKYVKNDEITGWLYDDSYQRTERVVGAKSVTYRQLVLKPVTVEQTL